LQGKKGGREGSFLSLGGKKEERHGARRLLMSSSRWGKVQSRGGGGNTREAGGLTRLAVFREESERKQHLLVGIRGQKINWTEEERAEERVSQPHQKHQEGRKPCFSSSPLSQLKGIPKRGSKLDSLAVGGGGVSSAGACEGAEVGACDRFFLGGGGRQGAKGEDSYFYASFFVGGRGRDTVVVGSEGPGGGAFGPRSGLKRGEGRRGGGEGKKVHRGKAFLDLARQENKRGASRRGG